MSEIILKEGDLNTSNLNDQSTALSLSTSRKLKGKLVHLNGNQNLHNVQVYLWGVLKNQSEAQLIGSGSTDKYGNFALAFPTGLFTDAFLKTPVSEEQVKVHLNDDGTLPAFVYAGFQEVDFELIDDCACHDATPRLPDEEDFTLTDTYSQDIGGSCNNFTTPNRALEEFSYYSIVRLTDAATSYTPEEIRLRVNIINNQIKTLSAQLNGGVKTDISLSEPKVEAKLITDPIESAEADPFIDDVAWGMDKMYEDDVRLRLIAQLEKEREQLVRMGRTEISSTNPVQWDDDIPKGNQAASLSFGHLLHFKQVWRADGYSLGDLVYSLPLAPGQKKRIAIMDWNRKETASRSEGTSYDESFGHSLARDRDINEIVNSVLSESMEGSSESKLKSSSWSIGASVSIPTPVSVGVSGGYSSSKSEGSSHAEQQAARDLAASNMQNIRDKSMQSASAVRNQRSTVITSMEQNETMTVQTEVLANYNHCHAITIQYFEVLRHFALHTELADVQECVFVPLTMKQFDWTKAAKWKDTLQPYLKASGKELQLLNKGFEACTKEWDAQLTQSNDAYADFPNSTFAADDINEVSGRLKLRINITRPEEIYPVDFSTESLLALPDSARNSIMGQMLINNEADRSNWELTLGFIDNWESIRRKVYNTAPENRDTLFDQLIAETNYAQQIISKLCMWLHKNSYNHPSHRFQPEFRQVSAYSSNLKSRQKLRKGAKTDTYEFSFRAPLRYTVQREDIRSVQMWGQNYDTGAFLALPAGSYFVIEDFKVQYRTNHFNGYLFQANGLNDDLNKAMALTYDTPLQQEELRNLRKEYQFAKNELIRHLNENSAFYHKILWSKMDAEKRLMLLEGFHVNVPGRLLPGETEAEPDEYRSLASVVENKIIAIVGNNIVMPVAKGYNLNTRFKFDNDTVQLADGKKVSKLHAYYMPDGYYKSAPYRVSVPTQGVFSEAVSGACNSCEKMDDTRYWKWEEHPIPDDTTEIQPISMDSRRAEPQNMMPSKMESPYVNIQNSPNLPDPTGMQSAMNLMGSKGIFDNITGLDQNQQNILAAMNGTNGTLQNAIAGSQAMAKQAGDMYKYMQNMNNSDEIEDKINRDKNLSKEEKKALLKQHYQNLLGNSSEDAAQAGNESIQKLIDKAIGSNKGTMKYTAPDGSSIDMNFEDEEIATENGSSNDQMFEIPQTDEPSVFDLTENVDFNDPDYIQQRQMMDDLLNQMQPFIQQQIDDINNNNTMA